MWHLYKISVICLVVTMIAGCASSPPAPTLADAMRGHSDEAQRQTDLKLELAKSWERGNELETAGERRVQRAREQLAKAEQEIEKAQESIERGNREIVEGRELKAESEREFNARFPDLSLNPASRDIPR